MRAIGWALSTVLLMLIVGSAAAQTPAPSAEIFVADAGNNRVVRIEDMTGRRWTTLGGPTSGSEVFSVLRGWKLVVPNGNEWIFNVPGGDKATVVTTMHPAATRWPQRTTECKARFKQDIHKNPPAVGAVGLPPRR